MVMINDYLKNYSNYYLSRYTVTKKKFQEILKKKINKDFFAKKINEEESKIHLSQIKDISDYFDKIGAFDEERLLEITFQKFVKKGYSKKKIFSKLNELYFKEEVINKFLKTTFLKNELDQILIHNYIKKTNLVEKLKKLNIPEQELFDKVLKKLSYQGFEYGDSYKILQKLIVNGRFS